MDNHKEDPSILATNERGKGIEEQRRDMETASEAS